MANKSAVRFYMYVEPALDHSWFRDCPAFHELRASSNNDNLAEVGLRRSLVSSKLRTHTPEHAELFYVPVFEFASFSIGSCGNTTHVSRMNAAFAALIASPYWQRYKGRDHFFASSAWSYGRITMATRMMRLGYALRSSIVGRYKSPPFPSVSRVGSCVIAIPWESNPFAVKAYLPPTRKTSKDLFGTSERRPILMHFAGALDVCCTGRRIRCAMGPLAAVLAGQADVIMRYIVPANRSTWKPCTQTAVELMEKRHISSARVNSLGMSILRSHLESHPLLETSLEDPGGTAKQAHGSRHRYPRAKGSSAINSSSSEHFTRKDENEEAMKAAQFGASSPVTYVHNSRFAPASVFEQTALEMASSVFCLMPAGDNAMRSIMYSAIAAGCLPVILCDPLRPSSLPFPDVVPWEKFWVKVSSSQAEARPISVYAALRSMNGSEVLRRQRIMARYRPDLVYGDPETRVGDNFVHEAALTRCAREKALASAAPNSTKS